MASYTIGPLIIPSGNFVMTIFNDNGDATDYSLTDPFILDLASLNEAVEENGLGGVLRIPKMDFTLYDRDGRFHDEIFDRATVTKAYAIMYLTNPITLLSYQIMFGSVKLSTIEYETIYDSQVSVVARKCSFEVLGLLDQLTGVDPYELRTYLDGVEVSGSDSVSQAIPQTGYTKPDTFSNDATVGTVNWVNMFFAGVPDGAVASVGLSVNTSKYLKLLHFTTFPYGYPAVDPGFSAFTVDGIEFSVRRRASVGNITDNSVKIVKAGVISGTEQAGTAGSSPWSATTEDVVYGSPTDLWGLAWSPTDFNASNFGLAFSVTTGDVAATANIDSVKLIVYLSTPSGIGKWVKVIDVFNASSDLMAGTFTIDPTEHEITDDYIGKRTSPVTTDFDNIYLPYKLTDGSYYGLFGDSAPDSFLGLQDVKEVVKSLAQAFLVYVDVRFNISNNHVKMVLKRRNTATPFDESEVGTLLSSVEQSFIGYDAVRIYQLGVDPSTSPYTGIFTPSRGLIAMEPRAFENIAQKFDFASPMILKFPGLPYLIDSGTFYSIHTVNIDGIDFSDYILLLGTKFLEYWDSPVLLSRHYGDNTGIMPGSGIVPVQLLSRITIDSIDYSAIEADRDFIANEVTLKLVQFS